MLVHRPGGRLCLACQGSAAEGAGSLGGGSHPPVHTRVDGRLPAAHPLSYPDSLA